MSNACDFKVVLKLNEICLALKTFGDFLTIPSEPTRFLIKSTNKTPIQKQLQ